MGRNLNLALRQELANLDKEDESRRSAMKALKSYMKDLDCKAIPMFVAQVSGTRETGSLSGEYTISLYEVLARFHGVNIVPQIDTILTTIIKTLASSAGSFPLQQACSKVVSAIARYGMEPTTLEEKKRHVIHSLCRPLSEALLDSQECVASGAALCLKVLVESDNWRFASDEMVNRVCQLVAVALEKKNQSNAHMALAMSLAKHNSLIVEAYARLLIRSGLLILSTGVEEGNSQKRLSAIQMVIFLMKCLDHRSIFSELGSIMEEMEKCQSDRMPYVSGAAFEALQTAKKIAPERGLSFSGSFFSRRGVQGGKRNLSSDGDQSQASTSAESQLLDSSIMEYDYLMDSPISTNQLSLDAVVHHSGVHRKLFGCENGGTDASSSSQHSGSHDLIENGDYEREFAGISPSSCRNKPISAPPSPQRSRSHISVDDINLFTTPRKLICSLQDPDDAIDSSSTAKQSSRRRSPYPSSPIDNHLTALRLDNLNGFHDNLGCEVEESRCPCGGGDELADVSVLAPSPTVDAAGDASHKSASPELPPAIIDDDADDPRTFDVRKGFWKKSSFSLFVGFIFAILSVLTLLMLIDDGDGGQLLVAT